MQRLLLILLVTLAPAGLAARAQGHLQVEKVSESVYLVRPVPGDIEAVSNAAFVVLPDRVLVFDTLSTDLLMREMMVMIRQATDLPIKMLVLSHFHPDHAGGLGFFADRNVTLYVGPGTAKRLMEHRRKEMQFLVRRKNELEKNIQEESGTSDVEPYQAKHREVMNRMAALDRLPRPEPNIEVTNTTTTYPGNEILFLNHPGHAHTAGDLMLFVAEERVLLAGDALSVFTLPNLADADTEEWILRLGQIEKMNAAHYVPGHGPLGTVEDVAALRKYLMTLREMVRPIADGGTVQDLVLKLRVPSPYDIWDSQDLWFPATLKVFQEMRSGS